MGGCHLQQRHMLNVSADHAGVEVSPKELERGGGVNAKRTRSFIESFLKQMKGSAPAVAENNGCKTSERHRTPSRAHQS